MQVSNTNELIAIASELGIKIGNTMSKLKANEEIDELSMNFIDYVNYAPRLPNFELVNQRLAQALSFYPKATW